MVDSHDNKLESKLKILYEFINLKEDSVIETVLSDLNSIGMFSNELKDQIIKLKNLQATDEPEYSKLFSSIRSILFNECDSNSTITESLNSNNKDEKDIMWMVDWEGIIEMKNWDFKKSCYNNRDKELSNYVELLLQNHYPFLDDIFELNFRSAWTPVWNEKFNLTERRNEKTVMDEWDKTVDNYKEREKYPNNKISMPSWGNMHFESLIKHIPDNYQNSNKIKQLVFTMLVTKDLNGWTFYHEKGNVIAIDIIVEPILAFLNTYFLNTYIIFLTENKKVLPSQYFIDYILPFILYFVFDRNSTSLKYAVMQQSIYALGKCFAIDQIKFIMCHELGHHFLNHNKFKKRNNYRGFTSDQDNEIQNYIRNIDKEFEADLFAINYYKSIKINKELEERSKDFEGLYNFNNANELLFLYIDMIERVTSNIKKSMRIETSAILESHPPAKERLSNIRMFNPIDLQKFNNFVRFTEGLIDNWLNDLEDKKYFESTEFLNMNLN